MASVAMTDMAHSLLKQVRAASDLPETVSAVVVAAMQLLVHHSQLPAATAAAAATAAPASSVGEAGSDGSIGDGAEMLAEFDAEWARDRGTERGAPSHLRGGPPVGPPPLRGDGGESRAGGRRSADLMYILNE